MKAPLYRVWDKVEKHMIKVNTLVWNNDGTIRQINGWINAITSGRFILMEDKTGGVR